MSSGSRLGRFSSRSGRAATGLALAILVGASHALAGVGTFDSGRFDFCVSVRFNASQAQLDAIKTQIQGGSDLLLDATDGQHHFGNVHIVNDSAAGGASDMWVLPGSGRAFVDKLATFGMRGQHATLYYGKNFTGATVENYTVAHEFSHLAYGVADEYVSPSGATAICVPDPPVPASLSACLMDNYYTRGGMSGSPTMNEFCVAGNHDPDKDTRQEAINHQSCWDTIAASRFPAVAPIGTPVDAAPASVTVDFPATASQRRFIIVIDRSGSMGDAGKLDFAKIGAELFVSLLSDGDGLAVVDFDDVVTTTYSFRTLAGLSDRLDAVSAIDGLFARDNTAIGDGLQQSLDVLNQLGDPSCQTTLVLLTDGMNNSGVDPLSVVPGLRGAMAGVVTVGLGSDADLGLLSTLADQTGGKLFQTSDAFGLLQLFVQLLAETADGGILAHSPGSVTPGGTQEAPVDVDSTTNKATFSLTWQEDADTLSLVLRDPNGTTITPANAAAHGVDVISGPHAMIFTANAPVPGRWMMAIGGDTVTGDRSAFSADALSDSTRVGLTAVADSSQVTFPQPVRIEATPTFDVPVVGASVTATVLRPDGTSTSVPLFDDGDPTHGDRVAGDGVYSLLFSDWSGDGPYSFEVVAVADASTPTAGESLFAAIGIPPNTGVVPGFRRMTTVAVVLSSFVAPPPPNDSCAKAKAISASFSEVTHTDAATVDPSDPVVSCTNDQDGFSVWYRITPSVSGEVTITTEGSDYDTVLTLYRGSCGSLTEVGCNDDAIDVQSQLVAEVDAGTSYLVEVSSYPGEPGGTLDFSVQPGAVRACAANADCDDGDACNGAETCDSLGECHAAAPLVCDDGLGCNGAETCNPDSGCVHGQPIDCSSFQDACQQARCVEPGGCIAEPRPAQATFVSMSCRFTKLAGDISGTALITGPLKDKLAGRIDAARTAVEQAKERCLQSRKKQVKASLRRAIRIAGKAATKLRTVTTLEQDAMQLATDARTVLHQLVCPAAAVGQ